MIPLLLPGIALVCWALFIITIYYSTYYSSVDHIQVDYARSLFTDGQGFFASPFGKYLCAIILIYGIYKAWSLFKNERTVKFSVGTIVGFFLLHLLVICGIYATMPE